MCVCVCVCVCRLSQAAAAPGAGGVSALSGPPSTTVPGSSQPLTQGQDRFFAPEEELQTGQLGANTNDQVCRLTPMAALCCMHLVQSCAIRSVHPCVCP